MGTSLASLDSESEESDDEFELMKAEIQMVDHSKTPYVNCKDDVMRDDLSDNSLSAISDKLRPDEENIKNSGTFSFGKR